LVWSSPVSWTSYGCAIGLAGKDVRARLDDRHLQKAVLGLGEIFGDDVVAAARIDRLVHHAEIVALKGDS